MTAAWDDGGGAGEGREEWKELREKEQEGVPVEEAADKDTQAAVSGDDAAATADSAAAAAGFQPVKAEPNAPKTDNATPQTCKGVTGLAW